jgi:predicted dehydrogenase
MTHADPVRVGLLGYGFAGRTFHAPLIRAVNGLALSAVASGNPDRVKADIPDVSVYATPDMLFAAEDIDCVVIATPNVTHAPLAKAALAAGKHVIIDKPFTLDMNEARELIGMADSLGLLLSVFHNRRWDSDYLSVRQAIEAGRIGRVVHFESGIERFRPVVQDRWRERGGPGAGLWFDLGPHLIDQALQLFGLPDRLFADLGTLRNGGQADDWFHVVLHYVDRRVILRGSMLVAGGAPRFVVHGTEGSLVKRCADQQENQLRAGMIPGDTGWGEDPDDLLLFDGEGGNSSLPATGGDQRQYYRGVADALHNAAPNPVRPIEALAVMSVIEAGFESARKGVVVGLPLNAEERASW